MIFALPLSDGDKAGFGTEQVDRKGCVPCAVTRSAATELRSVGWMQVTARIPRWDGMGWDGNRGKEDGCKGWMMRRHQRFRD